MKAMACALVAALAGCRTEQTIVTPDPHLERMIDQPKAMAYGTAPLLPHGMTMQHPPDGTLPFESPLLPTVITTGAAEGRFATQVPIPVDRALLATARTRFESLCAACHGVLGNGTSVVAEQMSLRKPPSLLVPPASTDPVGEVFNTIVDGYGLMPSYRAQLSDTEAWGIVVYLQALRLAQRARVGDLPPDVREQLAQEAP